MGQLQLPPTELNLNASAIRASHSAWKPGLVVPNHFTFITRAERGEGAGQAGRLVDFVGKELHVPIPEQPVGAAGMQAPEVRLVAAILNCPRLKA